MRRRAWLVYLVLGCVATLAFLLIHPWRVGALFNAIGISSPIVILVAMRRNDHVEGRLPWFLIALGQALFICGDVITYNYDRFFGTELPYPSLGDVFYLAVYPCLAAGILLLIRRRNPGRDRESAIDSLIVAIGVGVLSWVFLIAPYTHDTSLTLLQKLVSIGYPVMDLMLITIAVRLVVAGGRRPTAFYLMLAAVVALFVTDSAYGWISLHGGYNNQTGYLEGGWAAFYLLLGAAALHPSIRSLAKRTPETGARLTRTRLTVLAVISLTAPITQTVLLEHSRMVSGSPVARTDMLVVVVASVALFLLVISRMAGLVRKQEQSASREKALREAGAKLVTATNRETIHTAAL